VADLGQPISNQSLLVAAKIVLPGFPAVSIWIGLAFLFGDPSRYTSPSLDVAKDIMPIRTWGVLFLLVGAIELSALIFGGNRFWFSAALAIGAAMFAVWTVVLTVAIFTVPDASLTGPVYPAFIALVHLSFIRYLSYDWYQIERSR